MTNSEKRFQKWCKELGIFCHRLYDAKSGVQMKQYADFMIYHKNQLFLVEIKESKINTIHKSRLYQVPRMSEAEREWGIIGLFVLQFGDGVFRTMDLKSIIEHFGNSNKIKSISYIDTREMKRKEDLLSLLNEFV